MENTIVLYKSSTGFSKKYAEWIAEELGCKAIPIKDFPPTDISNFRTVIFGGGIHAGHINGLNAFKKMIFNMKDKNVVIFATGGAPKEATNLDAILHANFNENEASSIRLFYFHGGINYENMGFGSKILMNIFTKMLKNKKNMTPEEQGMYNTICESHDFSSKDKIKPLIEFIKEIK